MFLLLVTSVISSILLWFYVRWFRVKRYWAERGVAYIPPNPLVGNLTFLQRYNAGIWMKEMYYRCKSPYVGIWLFWRPALVVNCPEIGRRVLIKDASLFRDKLVTSSSSDPIGKNNLFTVKDPLWSSLRRRLTLVFTASKLRGMYGLIEMKTAELLQRINNEMETNKHVNLRIVFTDYTTDVIGGASLGFVGEATLTGRGVLRNVTKEFMRFNILRGITWISMFFWPMWVEIFRLNAFPKSSIKCLSEVYRFALAERGGYENEVTETRDLLDALIKIKQDCNRDNEDMPEETLIAQAVVFLQGGFDTTASVLSWCVFELAFNPDIQENLYRELLGLQKNNENLDIDVESLTDLKYLNAVIDETLRKYTPMGWMDRVPSQDYEIDENLTIPAGMPVFVNVVGIHYDPDIYPEPTKFNPDRFLIKDVDRKPVWSFGVGPRSCIGRRFAVLNIRYALARILVDYKCIPAPNTPNPSKVQIDKRSPFYSPGEPLLLEFVRRM